MRLMRSELTADVTVLGSKAGVTIAPGATVDVEREVSPGFTVADGLGELLERFTPVDAAVARRRSAPAIPAEQKE